MTKFFCHDIIEKDCEENCRDNDQGRKKRSCVTTIFPLSQHKKLKTDR